MVQRSLPFLLVAGIMSCKGDPTSSLRNGVNQLTADPTEIILDSATTQTVQIDARDEQGNPAQAKFSIASTGAGITVTFDSTFNVVRDANGNLKPQNPATRVRYIVKGTAVGASSFTISGGGKTVTVPVRVPPPAIAATIDKPTPNPGDTITVTLPAPYTFAFDPADTGSVATTIGGNTCRVVFVAADRTALKCIPLPGSTGTVALKNVLPNFGSLGAINVNTVGTVSVPLPTLTFTPANPQAGDTVTIIAPPFYDFRTTSAVTLSGATTFITKRVADTLKFLVGPGINAPLSITNLLVTGSAASSNTFTLNGGQLVTPAAPAFVTTPGGSVAIGSTVTVTAPGRYRFSPTATTVTIPSTLPGLNAGATVLSVSADSLTLTYAIGPNVDNATATIGGVRISAAAGLGAFSVGTDKAFTTPTLDQFPATLNTQFPVPGQAVTITAGAGFSFSPSSAVLLGPTLASAIIVAQSASAITFVPIPDIGKGKPVVTKVIQNANPAVNFTLPAAIYLTAPKETANDASTAPFITIPGTGSQVIFKDYGHFFNIPQCEDNVQAGAPCRIYRFTLATARNFTVSAAWSNTTDLGIYFLDANQNLISPFSCDSKGNGAGGQPETCTVNKPAGTYYLMVISFHPFYSAPDNVAPQNFTLTLTGN